VLTSWTNGLLWMKVWRERTAELLLGWLGWLGGQESHRRTTWARLARLAMVPRGPDSAHESSRNLGSGWSGRDTTIQAGRAPKQSRMGGSPIETGPH
jgi:hypothetical protein